MRKLILAGCALLAAASVTALLGQTVDGLDLEAVRNRSAEMQADAVAFAEQVKDRGDAFREDAASVRAEGTQNMERIATASLPTGPSGPIDFDEIVSGAAANVGVGTGEAPQLIVFASLSMPPKSLRALIEDTARAGGVVVFRGFPDNSMRAFTAQLAKVVAREDNFANIGIDPRLFRAFDVAAVPTYVAVSSDFDLCAGFSCRTQVPAHDRMVGNVTLEHALTSFAEANGPGARVAAVGLKRLRRTAP